MRALYRLILRLHPAPFRERFGAEMLWIFDLEGRRPRLLFDAVTSLLRQHTKPQQRPVVTGFALLDSSPGITPRRLIEASVTATLFLWAIFLFLGHPPRSVALPICEPGTPRPTTRPIQAPTHIQPLRTSMQSRPGNGYIRTGPEQIEQGVAGALSILRASNYPPGYCPT